MPEEKESKVIQRRKKYIDSMFLHRIKSRINYEFINNLVVKIVVNVV